MELSSSSRLGDTRAMARIVGALPAAEGDAVRQKRQMVAEFCRVVGARFSAPPTPPPDPTDGLSPRHVQTLQRLLEGDSEKQIAARLGVSPHTVHVYVKGLYRHFDVSSRGELLARFVRSPLPQPIAAPSPDRVSPD
jgi:DNA-binding CsgD family transcriptional regulator